MLPEQPRRVVVHSWHEQSPVEPVPDMIHRFSKAEMSNPTCFDGEHEIITYSARKKPIPPSLPSMICLMSTSKFNAYHMRGLVWRFWEPVINIYFKYSAPFLQLRQHSERMPYMVISRWPSGGIASRQTLLPLTQRSMGSTILRAAPLSPPLLSLQTVP